MGKILAYYTMPHPPIIIHEIGRGEEEKIKETFDACLKVSQEISNIKPDTIIIVTPHGPVFSDAVAISAGESIYGNLGRFGAPQIELNLDINLPLTEKIVEHSEREKILTGEITKNSAIQYGVKYELDHGVIVPLYFINKKYCNYKIIHMVHLL